MVTITPVRLNYHLAGQYNREPHEVEVTYLRTETDSCSDLDQSLLTKPLWKTDRMISSKVFNMIPDTQLISDEIDAFETDSTIKAII